MGTGATFSRLKVWTTEKILSTDLNNEFNNILTNLNPAGLDGAQDTLTAMRALQAPSENALATSLLQEIQEIRYMLQALGGGGSTYWYSTPVTSLTDLKNAIGGALVNNRLISGSASTTSSAPRFLTPNGAALSVLLKGTTTPFVYAVNGTTYTIAADLTLSGLSAGSGATQTISDASLSAQESSKTIGEDGTSITLAGAMSGTTAGVMYAFKLVHSATTEYFVGVMGSGTTSIINCFRGFFVDSTRTPIDRLAISNSDTITLMKLTWLYASTTGTLTPSYVPPTFSATAPTSPNTGDYWYDMTANTWKTYGGVSWAATNSTLIGVCIQDATNCVAARAFNFYAGSDAYSNINVANLGSSTTQVQQQNVDGRIAVNGNYPTFSYTRPLWDLTATLESGISRAVSTTFYCYLSEQGQPYLSTKKPFDMRGSLKGWYHPFENWRAVARFKTNATGSGNVDPQTLVHYDQSSTVIVQSSQFNPKGIFNLGISASVAASALTITLTQADGTPINTYQPTIIPMQGSTTTSYTYVPRFLTAPLTITVPSGATLGTTSSFISYVWIYVIDDAGVLDIGVSSTYFPDGTSSPTAITAGATSQGVLYSVSSHTSKSYRLIGRCTVSETPAGTWTNAPTIVEVAPTPIFASASPTAYTPAVAGLGTISAVAVQWSRRGSWMQVLGTFTTGTVAAAFQSITLPTGYNLDATKLPFAADNAHAGVRVGLFGQDAGAGNANWNVLANTTAATNLVYMGGVLGSATQFIPQNGNAATNSNAISVFTFEVPIAGWFDYGP